MPPSNRRVVSFSDLYYRPPVPSYPVLIFTDCKHAQAIVAGDNYDGNIYHQIDGDRLNAQWVKIFEAAVDGINYFYLKDRKHGKFLVAGDNYDGKVYHQDHADRLNAQWCFTQGTSPNSVFIKDRKHGKCLVAGDNDDNNVYHQDPGGRANACWIAEIIHEGNIIIP